MIYTLLTLFSFGAGISSILVVTSTKPIGCVISLILAFINSIGVLFILALDYLALIYTIVYVGAIAILFLFIIMLLSQTPELNEMTFPTGNRVNSDNKYKIITLQKSYFITSFIISILAIYSIWCGLFYIMEPNSLYKSDINANLSGINEYKEGLNTSARDILSLGPMQVYTSLSSIISNEQKTDIGRYGKLLYTGDYVWLIGISLILLIGMIGLITLILKNKKTTVNN